MTGAVALIVLAGVIELRGPQPTRATATPSPGTPSTTLNCRPNDFEVTGAYVECATIAQVDYCAPSFDQAKVIRLHGAKNDFLLYIEINGAYHGPGLYQLRPWPHPSLGQNDRMAKVALREYTSGRFFESSAGWLTVDRSGGAGSVSTGLVENPQFNQAVGQPVKLDLNLAGVWSCA